MLTDNVQTELIMVLPKRDSLPVFSTSGNKRDCPMLVHELLKDLIILLWRLGLCRGAPELGRTGGLAGGGQRENGFNLPMRKPGNSDQYVAGFMSLEFMADAC